MPAPEPASPRAFRFTMRSLLVFVVIVAIPLAWIAKERRQSTYEKQIAEQLRKLEGVNSVNLCGPYDSWRRYARGEPQGWWRDLASHLLGDRIIAAYAIESTWRDLTPLASAHDLQSLFLDLTQVSDLTPLAGLKKLRYLTVRNSPVTQEQIDRLQVQLPDCEIRFEPDPPSPAPPFPGPFLPGES